MFLFLDFFLVGGDIIKKIISLFMVVIITFVLLKPVEVHAVSGVGEILDPFIGEALDGSYGPTVAGILALIMSVVLVGETTVYAVKDMMDPTSHFYNTLKNETTPAIKNWFDDFCSSAVSVYDTSKTLLDVITYGDAVDLFEFIFPTNEVVVPITITHELSEWLFVDFKEKYLRLDNIESGTYDKVYAVYENIISTSGKLYGPIRYNNYTTNKITDCLDADYFRINQGYQRTYFIANIGSGNIPSLVIGNFKKDPYYTVDSASVGVSSVLRNTTVIGVRGILNNIGSGFTILGFSESAQQIIVQENVLSPQSYRWNTEYLYKDYGGSDGKPGETYNHMNTHVWQDLIYSNVNLKFDRGNSIFVKNNDTFSIDKSEIIVGKVEDYAVDNEIYLNEYVTAYGRSISLRDVASTDELVGVIAGADAKARSQGKVVLRNQVVAPPVETDLPFPLDWLINGLKELFRWLFVPSDLVLENVIANAMNTMENQAGLLTYPLTLVIRFLMAVSELDTNKDFIFTIPPIQYKNNVLYQGTEFNFSKFIRDNQLSFVQSIIYSVGNFIMILGMLNMARRKGDEIIRGI